MSQEEVYNILKKKKRWMTAKEIAKILDVTSTSESLKRLYKYGEIMRRITRSELNHHAIYKYKIR